ncbi:MULTISPECIES: hypothetical protein [unclassified Lentimonas]|uniref:hypothetical protein n=1 Tax=unclassified Lentimonas TaxID=2630993 RepID=UPI0013275D60|nr:MULTISPECIES: hypothetical protein [unclassified Lentimonas]CAA6692645.1 Unannotated [Lentimonas sp. CC19]CAA6696984.1 Unannotated [Lentimonas sp. CC10]CAA7071008.1 Unannotated [Lentimonas sp. CC11]
MKTLLPYLCAIIALTLNAAEKPWLYSEEVQFAEHHDFADVVLVDGRRLVLNEGVYHSDSTDAEAQQDDFIHFEDVSEEWQPERALLIAYAPTTGVVLVDRSTGETIEIVHGLEGSHPLDQLYKERVTSISNNYDMWDEIKKITALWETEVIRIYDRLAEEVEAPALIEQAKAEWQVSYDKQCSAISEAYASKPGTISSDRSLAAQLNLVRGHALSLSTWGQPVGL